jgi:hypothetical protein
LYERFGTWSAVFSGSAFLALVAAAMTLALRPAAAPLRVAREIAVPAK